MKRQERTALESKLAANQKAIASLERQIDSAEARRQETTQAEDAAKNVEDELASLLWQCVVLEGMMQDVKVEIEYVE